MEACCVAQISIYIFTVAQLILTSFPRENNDTSRSNITESHLNKIVANQLGFVKACE